jgi:hypothetical protein
VYTGDRAGEDDKEGKEQKHGDGHPEAKPPVRFPFHVNRYGIEK